MLWYDWKDIACITDSSLNGNRKRGCNMVPFLQKNGRKRNDPFDKYRWMFQGISHPNYMGSIFPIANPTGNNCGIVKQLVVRADASINSNCRSRPLATNPNFQKKTIFKNQVSVTRNKNNSHIRGPYLASPCTYKKLYR